MVKLDAFNYLYYGALHDTEIEPSAGAVDPMAARMQLDTDMVAVKGQDMHPTLAMTVTVDVRTGERRIMEFIMQSVLRYASEGLRERQCLDRDMRLKGRTMNT